LHAEAQARRGRTFFTPPVAGADLRAALVASCLRGALPPVDLLRGAAGAQEEARRGQGKEACVARATHARAHAPSRLLGTSHGEEGEGVREERREQEWRPHLARRASS
jgi:hypothetical protein